MVAKKLSYEKFQQAKSYLMVHGRDIEEALFRFYFENGKPVDVIQVLKKYQGNNGGFRNMGEGHAEIPNPMDTVMAFQILSEVGATVDDEVVQKGIQYIIESYDDKSQCWHGRPGEKSSGWEDNPCAELLGYLYEYRSLVPEKFLKKITEKAIASMSTIHTTKKSLQLYFLQALCLFRLAHRIDEPYKTMILNQLEDDIEQIIETNPKKWSTMYCAKPYFFATTPDSPLFIPIRNHVIRSLENEIKTQADEGNFILNWDCDEEGARVWKSIWTMDVLKALKFHNLIERAG